MSEIEAGNGCRLLMAGEELRHGDELLTSEGWFVINSMFVGERVNDLSSFRRRIRQMPERVEMSDPAGDTGVMGSPDGVTIRQKVSDEESEYVIITTVQGARQLADWLNSYADWREAQEEKGPPITRPAQAEGGSWKC